MNNNQEQVEDLTIEWVKRNKEKFIVKFDSINIPIEMNKTYYDTVLKQLQKTRALFCKIAPLFF